jgi:membrane protease YdiL (CAAX protease family)
VPLADRDVQPTGDASRSPPEHVGERNPAAFDVPATTTRVRVLLLAVLGEGALALAGLVWAWTAGYHLRTGPLGQALVLGSATAVVLAAAQYWLLRAAPDRGLVRGLRRLYREVLRPLFSTLSFGEIVLVSLLAGVGEELLFRGAVQPAWGLVAASVLFGLCHVGGRTTWPLGVWAGAVGLLLGWLAVLTDGLLAPIVAHAAYDALALSYIRFGPDG